MYRFFKKKKHKHLPYIQLFGCRYVEETFSKR